MSINFTKNLFVPYYYNEASVQETIQVNELLFTDHTSRKEFDSLCETLGSLSALSFKPSKQTLAKIMAYSQKTALVH